MVPTGHSADQSFAVYISYGCSFIEGNTASFRVPWALQMIPAIILFFGMIILPESPRWLATKDRWEECEQVLILTHGKGDPDSPWVGREYQEIKQWLEIERQSKAVSYIELFSPRYMVNFRTDTPLVLGDVC